MASIVEIDHTNLTARLDDAARQSRKQRPPRSIHMSGYFNCALQQWYALTGQEPTDANWEPEWELSAEVGNTIHGILQKRLVDAGIALMMPSFDDNPNVRHLQRTSGALQPAIEVPLAEHTLQAEQWQIVKSHGIGGRIDAVVQLKNGQPAIFELKTIAPKYLERPDYYKYFLEKVTHYELQVLAYLHLFRAPDGSQIDTGIIYVVNQGNFKDVRSFKVTYNPEFMTTEFERIYKLRQAIDSRVAPDPEPSRGPCRFCTYKSLCPLPDSQKRS